MKENSAHGFTEGSEVPKEQDAVHSQMADLEFLREYAKCGIHHNHAHNESNLKHKLQTLDAAISELTRLRSELQQEHDKARNQAIDDCIEILLDELEDESNTREETRQCSSTIKRMESLKTKP